MQRMDNEPTYKPVVRLIGQNGNAVVILNRVCQALSDAGQHDQLERYMQEALAGDRHHLLRVTLDFVEVE